MNAEVVEVRPREAEPLKVGNQIFKSVYDWELSERDLAKAAEELGETEEKKEACLRKLKEKLSNDSNVKYRQDDPYLLRFLRTRKYDVKRAYQNMRLFFELRKKHSEFFTLPQDLTSLLALKFVNLLPYVNEEGAIMIWVNFGRWNLEERRLEEMVQLNATVWDVVTANPHSHINGIIGVYDYGGLTMRHFSELAWSGRLFAIHNLVQNCYPWRVKKIIILNSNAIVRLLYNLLRPFIQRKIAERIILLGSDIKELHKHVNPVLLPKALNGTLEDESCDISQHVLDNLPYLRYERSFIYE